MAAAPLAIRSPGPPPGRAGEEQPGTQRGRQPQLRFRVGPPMVRPVARRQRSTVEGELQSVFQRRPAPAHRPEAAVPTLEASAARGRSGIQRALGEEAGRRDRFRGATSRCPIRTRRAEEEGERGAVPARRATHGSLLRRSQTPLMESSPRTNPRSRGRTSWSRVEPVSLPSTESRCIPPAQGHRCGERRSMPTPSQHGCAPPDPDW